MNSVGAVLLSVVSVKIMANGKCIETHALLDTGSQLTLLRNDIANKIGFDGPCKKLKFGTFHGLDPQKDTKRIFFSVTSIDNSSSFNVEEAYSISYRLL